MGKRRMLTPPPATLPMKIQLKERPHLLVSRMDSDLCPHMTIVDYSTLQSHDRYMTIT